MYTTGATRNAEISQGVSSKCLMGSCKAESESSEIVYEIAQFHTTLGATTVWICWVFSCFCIPVGPSLPTCQETHPGISVSGGKL